MVTLVRTLATLEEAIIALERRGISLKIHAERQDESGKLPVYHVFVGGRDEWFTTRGQLDDFVAKEEAAAGGKLNVDVGMVGGNASGVAVPSANGDVAADGAADVTADAPRLRIVELHEVRTINTRLPELAKLGFSIEALIPKERTGEEGSRYMLRRGENESGLEDLRSLPRPSAPPAKRACRSRASKASAK